MATVEQQTQDFPRTLQASTICEAFQMTLADRSSGEVALRTPGGEREITWEQYGKRVEGIAGALASLGVGKGDTVALMMLNRPEFNMADLGALHAGATPFSVYNTSTREQIEYLFSNAENRVVITERMFLPLLEGTVEHVILIEELEDSSGPSGWSFEESWRSVQPEDILTLIYTSGTTGPPKGVMLTHRSMMAELRGCATVLQPTPGGRSTSYLPSAHIADRWSAHYTSSIAYGMTITCVADPRAVVQALPEVRPSAWGAVPRIWEKMMAALQKAGITDPSALPEEMKAGVRAKLGLDECRWLVSGAAPIPVEVLRFFLDLGLPIQELWGMSETTCCATINPQHDIRIGTCGPPIPGVQLRLADDGELLVAGDLVMVGYRNDPDKTREAIDGDGWLHTGDVATFDDDGYVTIVDRKKELIINAAGKNMSPANIEARLKASHALIGQAVCIGDRRPYNVALIVLDPDACAAFAAENGIEDASPANLADHGAVQAAVAQGVEEANSHLARVEQIKRYKILAEEWLPGGDELTPTMKLKRKPIAEKYGEEIESLYA